jgi:hypothetical protein
LPLAPIATLYNPSSSGGQLFGTAVAIDGSRVVVADAYHNDSSGDSGRAYVYELMAAAPEMPVSTIPNPTPGSGDFFGQSVAISGFRIVAGACNDDAIAANAGSAYTFYSTGASVLTPAAALNVPSPAANDLFGYSVAWAGSRLVVGAVGDRSGPPSSGRVYVYNVAGATPTAVEMILERPANSPGGAFGISVGGSGSRVVVGSYLDNAGGSAYVFNLASATPTVPEFILNNPAPAPNDSFGYSVAISGNRVVVGASDDTTGGTRAGRAFAYDLAGPNPTIPKIIGNPNPASDDGFGASVAISGAIAVVSAPRDDTGVFNSGSAYVYDLTRTDPTIPIAVLNNPSPAPEDGFGQAVAVSGTRVVVGAYGDDTAGTNAGNAYVYDLTSADAAWCRHGKWTAC